MRYFLALLLAATSVRAYAASPSAAGATFPDDLELARRWAVEAAAAAGCPSGPTRRFSALQSRLASCSDPEVCRAIGRSALVELNAVLGCAAVQAEPVLQRLLVECDDFAEAKARQSSQRLPQAASKVKKISLSSLGIRYPEPGDGNPMLTDEAYRPHPVVDAQGDGGGANAAAKPEPEGPPVRWDVEVFGGGNIDRPNTISFSQISQAGSGNPSGIMVSGGPSGRPPFFDARVERWKGGSAWEFEGINSDNLAQGSPANGQDNDIMRGYDHFLINRAYELWGLIVHVGTGIVVTHPEPTPEQVAQRSGGSYYFSGLGGQAALTKRVFITDHAFATIEGKLISDVPQVSNPANTVTPPILSGTGVVGLGFSF